MAQVKLAVRRKSQSVKPAQGYQGNGIDGEMQVKALEALATAYSRIIRILSSEIDRTKKDVDRISDLGGHMRWVAERQGLVRTALLAGPDYVTYVCGDCRDLQQVYSLAEMAAKLANDGNAFPTTLNLLNYIDGELGWSQAAGHA